MAWSFSPHSPVYCQVAERIRRSILSGEYAPGGQIPSVRQLALEAAVNPNTIQHAFSELEDQGLIEPRGTVGRFVTENVDVIENIRIIEAEALVTDTVKKALELKVSAEKLTEMIAQYTANKRDKEDIHEHS